MRISDAIYIRDNPKATALVKNTIKKELKKRENSELYTFLKANKVEGKYIKNTTDKILQLIDVNDPVSTELYISETVKAKLKSSHPIDSSFTWSKTPQGHTFWNNLNSKFKKTKNNITKL